MKDYVSNIKNTCSGTIKEVRGLSVVCGIELKGSNAHIVTLQGNKQEYVVLSSDFKKVSIHDPKCQEEIKSFRNTLCQHFKEVNANRVGINARNLTGEHAGGAVSFKLEGLIQSCDVPVILIHPNTVSATLRKHDVSFDAISPKYLTTPHKIAFHLLEDE